MGMSSRFSTSILPNESRQDKDSRTKYTRPGGTALPSLPALRRDPQIVGDQQGNVARITSAVEVDHRRQEVHRRLCVPHSNVLFRGELRYISLVHATFMEEHRRRR
jgi:hypothetical protein